MAGCTGPKTKIVHKFGGAIFKGDKSFERENYPPGQRGVACHKAKRSGYAIQLQEKQKAEYTYGILERQFYNLYEKAKRNKYVTGEVLLQLRESRPDNVIHRMGIAPTRSAARQLVSHRHITLNGETANIPSYLLKLGDVVDVREKSKSLTVIKNSLAASSKVYEWLTWNPEKLEDTFVAVPQRIQVPESIKKQLIIGLYSK